MSRLTDKLPAPQKAIVDAAAGAARATETNAWLVGGPVRDLLLDRPVGDLDFVAVGDARMFARELAERLGGRISEAARFLTFRIELPASPPVDVVTARSEQYAAPGSLPVVTPGDIEEDLLRRDFSVNAIALRLGDDELVDVCGGLADIESRRLRILHDRSFEDDPTRMLRGVRLAARLSLALDPDTEMQMTSAVREGALRTISRERYWREFYFALHEPDPSLAVQSLADSRLLDDLLGLHASLDADALRRAIRAGAGEADARLLAVALLAGGDTKVNLEGSALSQRREEVLRRAIADSPQLASRIAEATDPGTIYDLASGATAESLALAAAREPAAEPLITRLLDARKCPIDGSDLGLPPGPEIGRVISHARRAVFTGEIGCDEAALFARRLAITYLKNRST